MSERSISGDVEIDATLASLINANITGTFTFASGAVLTFNGQNISTSGTLAVGAASCSTLNASGLITADGGLTVPSGDTLTMASGSTLSLNSQAITNSGAITASGGITVPNGQTLTMASGSTLSLNSQSINPAAVTASGLITGNAGITIPSGQVLTVTTGSTITGAPTWSNTQTMPSIRVAQGQSGFDFTLGRGPNTNTNRVRALYRGTTTISISGSPSNPVSSSTITLSNLGTATTGGNGTDITTGTSGSQTVVPLCHVISSSNSFMYSLNPSSVTVNANSTTFVIKAYQIGSGATASDDTLYVGYIFVGW